jgi:hypothetical protein
MAHKFTARERLTLNSLIDTLLPPWSDEQVSELLEKLRREAKGTAAGSTESRVRQLLRAGGSELGLIDALEAKILSGGISRGEAQELRLLLALLGTSVGTAALCLVNPWTGPFHARDVAERERILRWLANSSFTHHRKAFSSVKRLLFNLALTHVPQGMTHNPLWSLFDYAPAHELFPEEPFWDEFDYSREALLNVSDGDTLECDVCVVGSGAGGGVAAATLSQAGYSVIVLDKGPFPDVKTMSGLEKDTFNDMYSLFVAIQKRRQMCFDAGLRRLDCSPPPMEP